MKHAFLTLQSAMALALALFLSACKNNSSGDVDFSQLTDEQKAQVTQKGFTFLNGTTANFDDAISLDAKSEVTTDLAFLSAVLPGFEEVSYEDAKSTDEPFPAFTLDVTKQGIKLIYYYDINEHVGYAVATVGSSLGDADEVYDLNRVPIMTTLAENGIVASDWETSTTAEEQLIWVLSYFVTHPETVARIYKFTTLSLFEGKTSRLFATLVADV